MKRGQEQHYHFQDLTLGGPEIFWKRSVHVILKAIRTFQDLAQSNISKTSKAKNQIRYAAKKHLWHHSEYIYYLQAHFTLQNSCLCVQLLPSDYDRFNITSRFHTLEIHNDQHHLYWQMFVLTAKSFSLKLFHITHYYSSSSTKLERVS